MSETPELPGIPAPLPSKPSLWSRLRLSNPHAGRTVADDVAFSELPENVQALVKSRAFDLAREAYLLGWDDAMQTVKNMALQDPDSAFADRVHGLTF